MATAVFFQKNFTKMTFRQLPGALVDSAVYPIVGIKTAYDYVQNGASVLERSKRISALEGYLGLTEQEVFSHNLVTNIVIGEQLEKCSENIL